MALFLSRGEFKCYFKPRRIVLSGVMQRRRKGLAVNMPE